MGPIRILHTADWHLGHALGGHARDDEHRAFAEWLVGLAESRDVDAICIAGDVFDGRTPSGAAQTTYFSFLATLRARCPQIPVVIIAGNHDSPSRLSASGAILGMLGVHVFGAAEPGAPAAALALRLATQRGPIAVAAVPYVRPSDLADVGDGLDSARNAAALAALHRAVADEARRAAPGAPLVVLAHAHVAGSQLSPTSERPLFGFDADSGAISVGTFGEALRQPAAYVALGHLHFAQRVGTAGHVRYAGSPIPLSMAEADHRHSVSLVELGEPVVVEEVPIPRTVPMHRLEGAGGAPLAMEQVLEALAALPASGDVPRARHGFLSVRVAANGARPAALRSELDAAIAQRAVRLVRCLIEAEVASRPTVEGARDLGELDVRDVVRRRYEDVRQAPLTERHEHALGAALLQAAARVQEAREGEGEAVRQRGALG